ncbi:hypothetical protein Kpol_298p1 [Vanderwaltozyma polyspora DSM 70294]|uniref:Uncharacterized protein n=1 Tax=Vanderwaltozyma polyspora (strain ATCC 22028 / DSM 70294 / BCRC 21397 / CBS 2163 / NBRC 10782 / NRRL Y-8283 / UCD 57-17) TaxID=436907 RepID=A7TT54_VANPO|nr:uncharacterized protein Kpol_298p1 [Vanderwaltozyma polyspora DSM 70294]EDO14549.1 hypothetical protein Kpol_298p1 [Vanderwaltozyma polyspora DSM 70294]
MNYDNNYNNGNVFNGSREDSTKTFLTGNITNSYNIPKFPNLAYIRDQNMCDANEGRLNDPFQENLSASYQSFKKHNLNQIKKKLSAIARQKEEVVKAEQKFLKELGLWQQSLSTIDRNSMFLMEDIKELFQQDSIAEQNISCNIKGMVKNLEYVSKREIEYNTESKNVINEIKILQNVVNKTGEHSEESNFQKEKVIATKKSFEVTEKNFQQSISVNMRRLFKDLGITYHDSISDLREVCTAFIQKSLKTLEIINIDNFDEDLNDLRIKRVQKKWSKLPPNQKRDPKLWNNMMSGFHDNEDSLLRNVYKGLPQEYSPTRNNIKLYPKKELQSSPLNESFSDVTTKRFNPITTNQYFAEKSPENLEQENFDPNKEDSEKYNNIDKNTSHQVEGPRKTLNNNLKFQAREVLTNDPMKLKKPIMVDPEKQLPKKPSMVMDGINGYILNFGGEFSQQLEQAEVHLEENKWVE